MDIVRPADAASFLELAGPLVAADEGRHNLLLGIAGTLIAQPSVYPEFRFWVVIDAGEPVAAALRTPPHSLVVADPTTREALASLIDAARDDDPRIPGLVANAPFADDAAARWTARTGAGVALRFAQGVFELTEVADLPRAEGAPRGARADDRELLIDWLVAFGAEALWHRPPSREEVVQGVDARLEGDASGLWLWEVDGAPVSLAGFGGPTPTGIRIGPVYTPSSHRGRGYATSLVADLSRSMLAERGYRACFLFTDLANATSNAIYERIGYRRVADALEIRFADA